MSIEQIERMRKARKETVEELESKIERIKNDETLAFKYKDEQILEINKQLQTEREERSKDIYNAIEEGRAAAQRKLNNAEYEGLKTTEELLKRLLIEQRNSQIKERTIGLYGNDEEKMYELAKDKIDSNSPNAQGYVDAFVETFGKTSSFKSSTLLEEVEQANYNTTQKMYLKELNDYNKQKELYQDDTRDEIFQGVIDKY